MGGQWGRVGADPDQLLQTHKPSKVEGSRVCRV